MTILDLVMIFVTIGSLVSIGAQGLILEGCNDGEEVKGLKISIWAFTFLFIASIIYWII